MLVRETASYTKEKGRCPFSFFPSAPIPDLFISDRA